MGIKFFLLAVTIHLTSILQVSGQNDLEKKIKEEIWLNAPPEFKINNVPDKYKNESAVILALRMDYVGEQTRMYVEKVNIHFRVKLQDKAAVNDYSELSFDKKNINTNFFGKASSYSIVAIKTAKPDGKEKEIDLSKGVKTDAGSSNDFKIAVPDLEPGDILDYFIALKVENIAVPEISQNDVLEEKYPVVSRVINYTLPEYLTFKSTSFNGAPAFTDKRNGKQTIYTLEDKMHDKAPDIVWDYDHRSAPEVRYKITEKRNIDTQERDGRSALDGFSYNPNDIGFMIDFMKGNFKQGLDYKNTIAELYYMLRNPIYMAAYYKTEQGKPLQTDQAPDMFFFLINKYLIKYKIPHEILLVPGKHYGPFENLVNLGSCDLVMKIDTKPAIYLSRPKPFSLPNDVPYIFEGMNPVSKKFAQAATTGDDEPLPVPAADDNITNSKLVLNFQSEDKSKIDVQRNVEVKGHNKEYHQYMIFTNYDYLKEYDLPKYQVQSSNLLKAIIKENNAGKKKFEQRITQDYNERDKRIKDELEGEMDVKVSEYKNLSVKNIGMWHTNPDTRYTDEFTIENLTKKAGPNIIVEIGKLIEKQTTLKEEQKTRSRDVYMSYPRAYTYEITLLIPEGYAVEGFEQLNKKVENETGGFVSSAKVEGKSLVIRTKKYYSKNYYPVSDWQNIVTFLNPASDFNNAKLLLKKK